MLHQSVLTHITYLEVLAYPLSFHETHLLMFNFSTNIYEDFFVRMLLDTMQLWEKADEKQSL